jgi:molecular chaperone HscB
VQENHFTRFKLPVAFALDEGALEAAFVAAMKRCHPDTVALGDGPLKLKAMQEAVALHEAYHTLKDPWRRGMYLLDIMGIPPTVKITNDHTLLRQSMDDREQLEEAKGDMMAVKILKQRQQHHLTNVMQKVDDCFLKQQWAEMRHSLVHYRYLQKLGQEIDGVLNNGG